MRRLINRRRVSSCLLAGALSILVCCALPGCSDTSGPNGPFDSEPTTSSDVGPAGGTLELSLTVSVTVP